MPTNLAEKLIKDLHGIKGKKFSETVVMQAKRCLLDYLGAALAGSKMIETKGGTLLDSLGNRKAGDTSVIGFNRKAGIETTVFINGLSSHVAELDDGVISGIVHPGAPIFSALLPMAEKENATGNDLISGIITGYEASVRVADAIQPSHKTRGFHGTGTCGTIGVALGVAAMLGFSTIEMENALSAAAVTASGSLKVLEGGSELKPFNVGRAASGGLLAASMAKAGFNGPGDVFSGDSGFLSMMAESVNLSCLGKKEEEKFGIERVYVKPYASCRYTHPAVEAALKIKKINTIGIEKIASVKIRTYSLAVVNHDHTVIGGISSAKMSIPYSVAVALITDRVGLDEFSMEHINDPTISALTQKISVEPDEALSSLFPQKTAAIVDITTDDGACYSKRVDCPKGEPENPLSNDELEQKFIDLAKYGGKTIEEIHKIIEIVWHIETELPNLFELL